LSPDADNLPFITWLADFVGPTVMGLLLDNWLLVGICATGGREEEDVEVLVELSASVPLLEVALR
jgi:hypothetical protein